MKPCPGGAFRWGVAVCGTLAFACASPAGDEAACVDRALIVGGSTEAEYLDLDAARANAVVMIVLTRRDGSLLERCSGVVIGRGLALTAAHCAPDVSDFDAELRFGPDAEAPAHVIPVTEHETHPNLDLILLRFDANAYAEFPVEPLLPPADTLPMSLAGSVATLAGYGLDETLRAGRRVFAAERVLALEDEFVVVDGEGLSGACAGDSGGPLFGRALDGSVRVYGVLDSGSGDCRGQDRYTRLDRALTWAELRSQSESEPSTEGCGNLGVEGRCFGAVAVYCDGATLRREPCGALTCGFDNQAGGYRCLEATTDPCAGVPDNGVCVGDQAQFCDAGVLRGVSCNECADRCGMSPISGRVACVADG